MIHKIHLNPEPFEWIKQGKKKVEVRLYDEKRRKIELGDEIEFTNLESGEKLKVVVKGLLRFSTFKDMFEFVPKEALNHQELSLEQQMKRIRKYYSEENEKKWGVLGILMEF